MISRYVIPTSPVQEQATRVTGMTLDGNTLFKLGLHIHAMSLNEYLSLHVFHPWLTRIHKPELENCLRTTLDKLTT